MKKFFKYFTILLVVALSSHNVSYAESDNDLLWVKANEAYSISEYNSAVKIYKEIENSGDESWKLYYNLGNCYFKLGENGKAILYYEKALKLNPSSGDAANNLKLLRLQTVDKIDAIPEFVLSTFVKNIRNIFNSNSWAWISILFLALSAFMFMLYWFNNRGRVRKISFSLSILSVLICVIAFIFSINLRNRALRFDYGIVSTPVCNVKSAPNSNGNNIFVLHEGTKIEILEQAGGWSKIELADGRQGWAEQKNYEII